MRKMILFVLLLAGTAALADTRDGFPCRDHKDMVRDILSRKHEAFLSTAITRQGVVLQVFVDARQGDFTVIGTDDDGLSCVLLAGSDWAFAMERGI